MISVVTLRTELRIHLGDLDEDDLSNDDADLLLNRSFWEIIDKFPFREKERDFTFNLATGVQFYTAPSGMEAVKQISVQDPVALTWKPLERMTRFTLDNMEDDNTSAQAKPERYMRQENGFKVQPIPDKVYAAKIYCNITLDDLEAATPEVPIPQVWHEIILAGGVKRGFLRLQNFAAANQWDAHQTKMINTTSPIEAKEEEDTHLGGIDVPEDVTRSD